MKIPKKKELSELQKKYRTDKKIGEVYGVPARLVAYWRSKKKIGAYSFPKYSEDKVQELWDRFGDDERAGAELNISRAGFRQWRRKYNIIQRPPHLKLEQLELPLPDLTRRKNARKETLAQKILLKKSGLKRVEVGDVVNIEPDLAISHEASGKIISHFQKIGAERIWDPSRVAVVLGSAKAAENGNGIPGCKVIREFFKKQRVRNFYDVGQGVCHQLLVENAHVMPGQLAVSSDHLAPSLGSLGAMAIELSSSEMAAVWATGRIWLRVPETVKVTLNGRLSRGVSTRDIVLKIARDLQTQANYRVIEFHGPVVCGMSMSERLTLAGSAADIGAKSAIIPFDETSARFLRKLVKSKFSAMTADQDAAYAAEIEFDMNYLTPQVSMISDGIRAQSIEELAGKRIDQVVIGCCSNGRIDDLEVAARLLRGRRISRDLRAVVIPASMKIYAEALDRGFLRALVDAGCIVMSPGCGSCIEAHLRMLEPGEKALSTSSWSCPGCHDLSESEIYLASPATAAASALDGSITDPRKYMK